MMNKKFLIKGFAALALVAGFSSCVKDVDGISPAEEAEKAKENAELQLGLNIPDGQTWEMSQQIAANVTVDLNADETYTVGICDKNPLNFADAKYYALKKAESGKISATFTAPVAKSDYYVIAYNSKYQAIVNKVEASNGVIDANVSYTSGASGTMRSASRRGIASVFTFPSAPDKNVFATAVPEGCTVLTRYQVGNRFEINGTSASSGEKLQPAAPGDSPNIEVYVSESVTLNKTNNVVDPDPVYFPPNVTLYLLPNVKMTINCDYNWEQSNGIIYIADGAELAINGVLGIGSNCKIITAGTGSISANQIIVRVGATLYNQGTIDISEKDNGELSVENNNSVIVNDGTIKAKRLHTAGSGHVQNNGTMIISGNTDIDSNNNTWVNNGLYQTQYFFYTAGSNDVINNCKLIVDEDFNINLATTDEKGFRMDSKASTITKNFNGGGNYNGWRKLESGEWEEISFNGGPFFINMGAGSVFKVTNTATMNASLANYGIYGPEEGGFAVFQAKEIVAGKENQGFEVTYGGNLAVVCETHFAQGNDGREDHPLIDFKGNATIYEGGSFKDGKSGSVAPDMETIEASLCNPGFDPGEGDGDEFLPEPAVYSYAFEDQISNGDYDMNDVVLKVSYHAVRDGKGRITEIKENKLDVKMVAAGATFKIKAFVGETALFGGKEIHDAFKVSQGVMVNTGAQTATPVVDVIDIPDGTDIRKLNVWIWVNPETGYASETKIYYLTDKEKPVPYAVMIPADWAWPKERVCVTEAYPDENFSFKKWAETTGSARDKIDWYNHPATGKVMSNN